MDFVENIWVGHKRSEAGFSTEQNRSSTIFCSRIVRGVGVTKDASAQGDELPRVGVLFNASHKSKYEIASPFGGSQ